MAERTTPKKGGPIWKIGLAAVSTVGTYLAVLLVSKFYAATLDLRDPEFRYEHQIGMWKPDPVVGFRNKPLLDSYCFGNVRVTTNEHGFRGRQPTSLQKRPGATRIIGIGDSVMWGSGVNNDDSLLGKLQKKLDARAADTEVINAGVVGYSTLQEWLLLEEELLAFSPDVVLVNFCANDLLPTEDPFQRFRNVYIKYMTDLIQDPDIELTDPEKGMVGQLIPVFQTETNVLHVMANAPTEIQILSATIFLEIPVRRMIQRSKERHIRLIYLLIPLRDNPRKYQPLVLELTSILDREGVEYLNFAPLFSDDAQGINDVKSSSVLLTLKKTLFPDLHNIQKVRRMERIHRDRKYIDLYHPSKTGNEIIAEHVFQLLSGNENQ